MPPALRIVRKSSFTPKPWKNGGGVTHEAMRMPPEGDIFAWRVSVAHIEASGPFSDFAGYSRKMVLLKGDGLELEFEHGREQRLARVGDMAEFDGAPAPHCRLIGGPCVDLNLMVAKAHAAAARVHLLRGMDVTTAGARPGETTLIFSINDAVTVTVAGAEPDVLQPFDLGVFSNGSARVSPLESRATSNPSAVFFATISD